MTRYKKLSQYWLIGVKWRCLRIIPDYNQMTKNCSRIKDRNYLHYPYFPDFTPQLTSKLVIPIPPPKLDLKVKQKHTVIIIIDIDVITCSNL